MIRLKPYPWAFMLLSILAVSGLSASGTLGPKPQMLMPGKFHGDEVTATAGKGWLGLFLSPDRKSSSLKSVQVQIQPTWDEVMDSEHEKTGKEVTVIPNGEPLFLFSHVPGLIPGPVTTVFSDGVDLPLNRQRIFHLPSGYAYLLKATGRFDPSRSPVDPKQEIVREYQVILERMPGKQGQPAGGAQVLYRREDAVEIGDGTPKLLWVGDLDHDGKLDLVMDMTTHYNVSIPTLFLSRPAKGGELLHPMASFPTTGC